MTRHAALKSKCDPFGTNVKLSTVSFPKVLKHVLDWTPREGQINTNCRFALAPATNTALGSNLKRQRETGYSNTRIKTL